MKYILILLLTSVALSADPTGYQIDLARAFGKEIFETNGIPYLTPLVQAVNATSNSRFMVNAYVPKKVEKAYFRITANGMSGVIRDDQKTFNPTLPMEAFDAKDIGKYIILDVVNNQIVIKSIPDTAALILYAFKNMLYTGDSLGNIKTPKKGATVFGNLETAFIINRDTLKELAKIHPVWGFLPKNLQDTILSTFAKMPEYYSLNKGGNIDYLMAGIPQIEIGSLWGTELLLRYIPPVNLGDYIGDFTFWGIGLKHSLSQYFPERYFDMSLQAVYQGTNLEQKFGVTNSELSANANIWNVNLQISKSFEDEKGWIKYLPDVFMAFSYESLNIKSKVKYYMSVETQAQLGLLPVVLDDQGSIIKILPADPANGYPGDTKPTTSTLDILDTNFKTVIGLSKTFSDFSIFADYNISKFNIFSAGIGYRF